MQTPNSSDSFPSSASTGRTSWFATFSRSTTWPHRLFQRSVRADHMARRLLSSGASHSSSQLTGHHENRPASGVVRSPKRASAQCAPHRPLVCVCVCAYDSGCAKRRLGAAGRHPPTRTASVAIWLSRRRSRDRHERASGRTPVQSLDRTAATRGPPGAQSAGEVRQRTSAFAVNAREEEEEDEEALRFYCCL